MTPPLEKTLAPVVESGAYPSPPAFIQRRVIIHLSMAGDDKDRTTSFTKTLQADHLKSSLDRALKLKEHFGKAKAAPEKASQEKSTPAAGGKTQGNASQSKPKPSPGPRQQLDKELQKESALKADLARTQANIKKLSGLVQSSPKDRSHER